MPVLDQEEAAVENLAGHQFHFRYLVHQSAAKVEFHLVVALVVLLPGQTEIAHCHPVAVRQY